MARELRIAVPDAVVALKADLPLEAKDVTLDSCRIRSIVNAAESDDTSIRVPRNTSCHVALRFRRIWQLTRAVRVSIPNASCEAKAQGVRREALQQLLNCRNIHPVLCLHFWSGESLPVVTGITSTLRTRNVSAGHAGNEHGVSGKYV